MPRGFRLARIAGIEVYLDWSLAIIFFLVTFSLAVAAFPVWHPDWGAGTAWLTAAASAVLFLASVLIHEFSHALVGRRFGIEVPSITLFVFGGMAQMEDEPQAWRAELWMALAGPVTSFVLGVAFIMLGVLVSGPLPEDDPAGFVSALSPLGTLLFWLGPINIVLAVFNLVPGFPLDGGRVLRAVLWGATGDRIRATRWASAAGRAFAWLLIGTGIAMVLGVSVPIFGTGVVGGLWLALIGWFLHNAAVMSYRQLLVRESLLDVPVARLMRPKAAVVPPRLTVREFVDEHLLRGEQRAFAVEEGERLQGLVCLRDVHRTPRDEWDSRTVADIMTPADRLASLGPDADGLAALNALNTRDVNQLPVVDRDRVIGMVTRDDVLRWLSIYGDRRLGSHGR